MPIPEAPAAAGPYNTDGVTTTFAFAYKSFGVGYHAVVKETSGVQEQLVYGVDFAVTQNADQESNPGGNVLISPALPSGSTLTIYSNVPYDQPFDPSTAGGSFRTAAVRDAIDRVVTLLKQSNLATSGGTLLPSDRSLRVPSGESINALPVAASRADKILLFDGSGNASVATLGDLALLLAGGSMTGDINMSGNDITNAATVTTTSTVTIGGNTLSGDVFTRLRTGVATVIGGAYTTLFDLNDLVDNRVGCKVTVMGTENGNVNMHLYELWISRTVTLWATPAVTLKTWVGTGASSLEFQLLSNRYLQVRGTSGTFVVQVHGAREYFYAS